MVEQLGFAMMWSSGFTESMLISGTTSGISSLLRHADELSITVQPNFVNCGEYFKDDELPAENMANVGFAAIASATDTIVSSFPAKVIFFPTDFSEAAGINSACWKPRSSNTLRITLPTNPVAPTKAIFILSLFLKKFKKLLTSACKSTIFAVLKPTH